MALPGGRSRLRASGCRRREMGSVFISHVEEDHQLAIEIATGLEAAGFETWYYERDSDPGPSYLIQVHHAIEKCVAVVLLISPNSIQSHQMTKEVVCANDLGKPFIPVRSNISHAEFQDRQPEWNIAIGGAASIPVPPTGLSGIMPRLVRGLEVLRSHRAQQAIRHEDAVKVEPVSSLSAMAPAEPPVDTLARPAAVTSRIATGSALPAAPRVSPAGPISGDIVHGRDTMTHETVLTSSKTSERSRPAAALAVAAVIMIIVGAYVVVSQRSPASNLTQVASSNLTSDAAAGQESSKPADSTARSNRPDTSPEPGAGSSATSAPTTVPGSSPSSMSQPNAASNGTADKNVPPAAAARGFDEDCRRLLEVVRDGEKTKTLSEDARTEIARIGRRIAQMRQEYTQNERDQLGLTKLPDTDDFAELKRRLERKLQVQQKHAALLAELTTIDLRLADLGLQVRHIRV
jgi:hypothetical protein